MILCCLIPVAALGIAVLMGARLSGVLTFALVLLCPLSHLLMMGLFRDAAHEGHTHGKESE
jgi:hypothetical protein